MQRNIDDDGKTKLKTSEIYLCGMLGVSPQRKSSLIGMWAQSRVITLDFWYCQWILC